MSIKPKKYSNEFKQQIVRIALESGRTIKSINNEYNLGEGTVRNWIRLFHEECDSNPVMAEQNDLYEENRRLKKELAEAQKENLFLKKAAAFFAKEID